MSYLNVSPMISALRTSPEQFEFSGGSLHHIPSRHSFHFAPSGKVTIYARCGCASMSIQHDQEVDLIGAFRQWVESYWRPIEVNREFASHFNQPGFVRRTLISLTNRLNHSLLRMGQKKHHHEEIMVPAE